MSQLPPRSAISSVKSFYQATRAVMEATLRPYDLGSTQWYVLWQLVNNGVMVQRDFLHLLEVEKPTLSEIVGALTRKGFITQTRCELDQRQRLLAITPAGLKLWQSLPDPVSLVLTLSFDGVEQADLDIIVRVLQAATSRLTRHLHAEEGAA